jgi:hypothetical protein
MRFSTAPRRLLEFAERRLQPARGGEVALGGGDALFGVAHARDRGQRDTEPQDREQQHAARAGEQQSFARRERRESGTQAIEEAAHGFGPPGLAQAALLRLPPAGWAAGAAPRLSAVLPVSPIVTLKLLPPRAESA